MLHSIAPGCKCSICCDNGLGLVSEILAAGTGVVPDIRKHNRCYVEVGDGDLVAAKEIFAVLFEVLVQVGDDSGDVTCKFGLPGFREVFSDHEDGVELSNIVVGVVNESISLPCFVGISWVVSEMLSDISQHSGRLVQVLAIVHEYGKLTVGELTCCLAGSELFASQALVLPVSLGVGKCHTGGLSTTVDGEVNDFVFCHTLRYF